MIVALVNLVWMIIVVLIKESDTMLTDIIDSCITAITIVVVAVPEGLPLAVTLALALSVKKMQVVQDLILGLIICSSCVCRIRLFGI